MKKPEPTIATVVSATRVSPNMQRIILQSDKFSSYPADCEGGYVKLLFNSEGGTKLPENMQGRPVMRTYTIRRFDLANRIIEIDFVRHISADQSDQREKSGYASHWADVAKPGDVISLVGPGLIKGLNSEADWFFLVADMTALPAMSVKLKSLQANAKGYAVIEVASEEDIQSIAHPEGIQLEWVVKPQNETSKLQQHVFNKSWLDGQVSVWCACEFDSMKALRQYFRNEKEIDKENIYISSYWKNGVTEDGHKIIKNQDAQTQQ